MSKAFTKEDSDVPEAPTRRRGIPVPADGLNYLTPDGERALRAELAGLAAGDEERAHELAEHLATAVTMGPPDDTTRVGFGAKVTVEHDDGKRTTYRLVGAIEAAPREGKIYWRSPIAEALYDARVGDSVALPRTQVSVVAIAYT
ncbi:MAG: GreA/GreB family elongation factor [Kofleriaceae bacterium]|nr:GreA/GreB family elongation factor [Kofleriaceae bacterium]